MGTNGTEEVLAELIVNAMRTQQEDEPFPAYIGVDGLENVVIDGGFDLVALARDILAAGYTPDRG